MSTATRILLVDDESGILDTLRILLRGNGYDVVAALSGRERPSKCFPKPLRTSY